MTKRDIDRANKRRKYSDGRGLFLSVSANGRKTWSFCYRFLDPTRDTTSHGGKLKRGYRERELSLGSIDFMDVDEARDRAVELRRLVRQGVDPMQERDRETRQVVRQKRDGSTFKQVAERYIDMKKAEWDAGGASEQSWRGSLGKHVFPVIGEMAVDRIDRADILDTRICHCRGPALRGEPGGSGQPAQVASECHQGPHAERHKALAYRDAPAFMRKLRERKGIAPRALEFTIMTALRTSEVIGATWDEIDMETGIWTIPAERMKIKRRG